MAHHQAKIVISDRDHPDAPRRPARLMTLEEQELEERIERYAAPLIIIGKLATLFAASAGIGFLIKIAIEALT